jgi:apoptosis-inducing factor 3
MQTKVSKIIPSSSNPSVASAVEIPGKILDADVVVMGVGVVPATELLKESGIKLERDGGLTVDEYLKVKGFDDVYAIGEQLPWPCVQCR